MSNYKPLKRVRCQTCRGIGAVLEGGVNNRNLTNKAENQSLKEQVRIAREAMNQAIGLASNRFDKTIDMGIVLTQALKAMDEFREVIIYRRS